MKSRFLISAAVGVLLAAASLGAANAASTSDAGSDLVVPPANEFNTDNGVRAAPSGQVDESELSRAQRVSARPVNIANVTSGNRAAGAKLIAVSEYRQLSAGPAPKLVESTVQLADALAPPAPSEPAASAAATDSPAPAAPPPSLTPVTAAPVMVVTNAVPKDPDPTAETPPDPAPTARLIQSDVATARTADPDPTDAAAAGREIGPEEASVYGLPQPVAADPSPQDPAAHDPASQGAQPLGLADVQRPAAQPVDEPAQQRVSFPRHWAESAAAFDRYMRQAGGIAPGMKSRSDVANALGAAAAYEPAQFEEGMIAYGAIAALQDARFVYAVMDIAALPSSRQALVDDILADPTAAEKIPGAGEAAALATRAILREDKALLSTGMALKQEAYDVQHEAWSLAKAEDGPGRLARAKAASAESISSPDGDMTRLIGRIAGAQDSGGAFEPGGAIADRSIALAALAVLNGADGQDPSRLGGLLSEASSAECLKLSKLNLFQCLSVAGPEYEDVFCLGQHAVLDTARCVAGAAGPSDGVELSATGGGAGRGSALTSHAPQ
jgi:hypothetical protein